MFGRYAPGDQKQLFPHRYAAKELTWAPCHKTLLFQLGGGLVDAHTPWRCAHVIEGCFDDSFEVHKGIAVI